MTFIPENQKNLCYSIQPKLLILMQNKEFQSSYNFVFIRNLHYDLRLKSNASNTAKQTFDGTLFKFKKFFSC